MRFFITGGSGFVGSSLTAGLVAMGGTVTILTRRVKEDAAAQEGVRFLEGDPTQEGPWQDAVADHDVVINMAGETIFQRWNRETKQRIYESRILTTRNLSKALTRASGPPRTLISTSAVGYYGFSGSEVLDESSPAGEDFLARLARDWETEALRAAAGGVRVVICRFGIVFGRRGGALGEMVPMFRRGLGSSLGSGQQWISWIHEKDLVGIYLHLLGRSEISGAVNCTAPNPVTNRELTDTLATVLDKPAFLPAVPAFVLKWKMGEMASILLNGQKVCPMKLLDMGYRFQHPTLEDALTNLLA